jgi:pimeloyl-ACP methyl ester carboxylesterase
MNLPVSRFVDGTPRLHYLEWNPSAAPTLVFLHGNCANAWWWQPIAQALAGRGWRLLALDLRGHGDSEWARPPSYSPLHYADDLARLIRAAAAEDAIAVGHSMGGIAVLTFAMRDAGLLRAAVAIDIAITSERQRNRYLKRLRTIPTINYADLATAKARFRLMPDEGKVPAGLVAEIAERSIRPVPGGGYTMKFDRASFVGSDGLEVAAAIRAMRMPLLLVRAQRSRIMTAEAAEGASRSNRLVQLVTIPDAHHHLPLEAPVALARAIERFTSSQWSGSTAG